MKVKIGDYVCFNEDDNVLIKVLDIRDDYFLYFDPIYNDKVWEKISYIDKVFELKERSE